MSLAQASVRGTTPEAAVAAALTVLFVPGDRPERFAKATGSGADAVILDLEDAVRPEDKDAARGHVVAALSADVLSADSADAPGQVRALVRVNAPEGPWYDADLAAVGHLAATAGHGLLGIVLPKAEDPARIVEVRRMLPAGTALVPLVESALGVVNALQLARVPGVTRLAFGAVDFSLDIGAGEDPRALDHARSTLVVASRAAGIAPPLDSPSIAIKDLDRVAAEAAFGRNFGFGGKLCIHPAQLEQVRAAFAPSAEDIEWATRVLSVADTGAAQVGGEMIDRPVIERARRVLARAGKEHA